MVAAWLKIATLVLKASPASKKQRPHRQNEFSEHQNASNADALTGAGGFCKKLQGLSREPTPKASLLHGILSGAHCLSAIALGRGCLVQAIVLLLNRHADHS
jgi:hypothetical protein